MKIKIELDLTGPEPAYQEYLATNLQKYVNEAAWLFEAGNAENNANIGFTIKREESDK